MVQWFSDLVCGVRIEFRPQGPPPQTRDPSDGPDRLPQRSTHGRSGFVRWFDRRSLVSQPVTSTLHVKGRRRRRRSERRRRAPESGRRRRRRTAASVGRDRKITGIQRASDRQNREEQKEESHRWTKTTRKKKKKYDV